MTPSPFGIYDMSRKAFKRWAIMRRRRMAIGKAMTESLRQMETAFEFVGMAFFLVFLYIGLFLYLGLWVAVPVVLILLALQCF